MQGTFEAIVNASIAQMEAYSELMMQATLSAGSFMQSLNSGTSVADLPAIQQAAAVVAAEPTLKGVNRLVVKDGKVAAKAPRKRAPAKSRAKAAAQA